MYVPNYPTLEHLNILRQILRDLKGAIDWGTEIEGDFNNPLSAMEKSFKQKINKESLDLNYTLDQMDPEDITEHFIQH
jgi:hypothetical protein